MQRPAFNLEEVFRADRKSCAERALALEAAGIPYGIHERPEECAIVVAAADLARARAEIEAYAEENPVFRPARFEAAKARGWIGALGYAAALLLVAALQHNQVFGPNWLDAGRMDPGLIREGQLWRAVTALTLHADLVHLVGNLVIGGLMGLFAGQLLGSGLAWLSILLSGAAGNLLTASFRPVGYTSIGASTAVFAAVGILAAYEWARRRNMAGSLLIRFAPLVGGVVLLAYLGAGGERTDVIAHVAGFVAGLLLGAGYGKTARGIRLGRTAQIVMGIAAAALLTAAWTFALILAP